MKSSLHMQIHVDSSINYMFSLQKMKIVFQIMYILNQQNIFQVEDNAVYC